MDLRYERLAAMGYGSRGYGDIDEMWISVLGAWSRGDVDLQY